MLPVLRRNASPAMSHRPVNRLDSWFDRFFEDFDQFLAPMTNAPTGSWAPSFDVVPLSVWEDEDHIYVEADLPGLTHDDVEVTVHNGRLLIKGERKADGDRPYVYNTRTFGQFERFITLPETADVSNVQAAMTDGVLRLTLAKRAEAKPRKIAIQANG